MKTLLRSLILVALCASAGFTQPYKIDTLVFNGDPKSLINIVILGDGYTASEQDTFRNDAINLSSYIFTQSPWSNYKDYFNIFAVEVASQNSGTTHPNTAPDCDGTGVPTMSVSTVFGCTFDAYDIHRLVVPMNNDNIAEVLSNAFPNYDQVLIIAHSQYYGGSGGAFATGTVNFYSGEVITHEVGHSFAKLADEYWAGPQYAAEKPNMTQQANPSAIKWRNWLTPAADIGIIAFSENTSWYRPGDNCKMRVLNGDFCSVCKEQIIETIHELAPPIIHASPEDKAQSVSALTAFTLDTLLVPIPNTLRIKWTLDGVVKSQDTSATFIFDPSVIPAGSHTLAVSLVDTSALLRKNGHFTTHIYSVSWTIQSVATSPGVTFPKEIAFGDVSLSTGRDTTVWFHNPGSSSVSITSYALAQTGAVFSFTDTSNHTIKAHDSTFITLRAKPTQTGAATAALTIRLNEGVSTTHTITLSANGINSKLIAYPTILDFGSIDSGAYASRYFRIANNGNESGSVLSVSQPDKIAFTIGDALITIPAGKDDSILVTFHPMAAGTFSQTVTVTTTEASPLQITLQGIGLSVKDTTSSSVQARVNSITASLYPNPATSTLTASISSRNAEPIAISIVSTDGKVITTFSESRSQYQANHIFDISNLPAGAYTVIFKIGLTLHEERFIKY